MIRYFISILSLLTLALTPLGASAGECTTGLCGTPDQSGGAGGGGAICVDGVSINGSILVAMTDRGDTYQFADDFDGDGFEDEYDNCPFQTNIDQMDVDGDGVGDGCDICETMHNPLQENLDGDALGDVCDDDMDGDLVIDTEDNCLGYPNRNQTNTDGDLMGDACDEDDDDDGILDIDDGCRLMAGESNHADCDNDPDGDGIPTGMDNCPTIYNPGRDDMDGDGLGDLCDGDRDADGVPNWVDNCPGVPNASQIDTDHDGLGDAGNFGSNGAQSCDMSECYYINADMGSCLDPNTAFTIQVGMILETLPVDFQMGDRITVPVFSNRFGELHNWTAIFKKVPSNSDTVISNARGSGVTLADGPQVANCVEQDGDGNCQQLNSIYFEPDEPGRYELKVNVELPNGDPQGLGSSFATATASIDLHGESAGGCSAAGAPLWAAALGLLALVRRRKSSK